MEHTISVSLLHLGMNVEARITKLGDLLRQQLDSIYTITKNDRLIDLQLGEESVEAMDFLPLLNKGVVLCHTFESKFVHKIDFVWFPQESIFEVFYSDRESS